MSSRRAALSIVKSGLKAVMTHTVMKSVERKGNVLYIKGKKFNLAKYDGVYVIGFGKSSYDMAKHMEKVLGNRINGGIVISNRSGKLKHVEYVKGTHPHPSAVNVSATKRIEKLLKNLGRKDLVLCLISGGGSSLLCHPTIPLKQYLSIIKKEFLSGKDIYQLNRVRKKYSHVKGGKLGKMTKAKLVSLVFSDVMDNDLSVIASGPTYGSGEHVMLLTNKTAIEAMKEKATQLGFKPKVLTTKLSGEASLRGKRIANSSKKCLLFAGETTVMVKGKGKGGRNQEFCLGAIESIAGTDKALVSLGTDGIDGLSNAAGAVVDGRTLSRAQKLGLNPDKYLKNNDSHNFFRKLNDQIITGNTGTNVSDIGVLIQRRFKR